MTRLLAEHLCQGFALGQVGIHADDAESERPGAWFQILWFVILNRQASSGAQPGRYHPPPNNPFGSSNSRSRRIER